MSFSKKFPCKRVSRCFSCLLILFSQVGLAFDVRLLAGELAEQSHR